MIYNDFKDIKVSSLGFGTMRLPVKEDKTINEEELAKMVDFAIENGVNYFDTAYPYHSGRSEIAIGKALKKYPRDSWYLANKYPGHQVYETYNVKEIFEEQLMKCSVDYFDFYLLHNVYERSAKTYKDPKWGIIEYLLEQKEKGKIKYLGFSCHSRPDGLEDFLDFCGDKMDFCQIQLNYLDWTLQDAEEKYKILTERNIPIWVMEPLRGGRLADLPQESSAKLRNLRPDEEDAAWAFRFLQDLPNVKVVLSGMSDFSQMVKNVKTFSERKPLSDIERGALLEAAESLKNSVPCTGCGYCLKGCPMGLEIPMLIKLLNDFRYGIQGSMTMAMAVDALSEERLPTACIGCGACAYTCPQKINVPDVLSELSEKISTLPSWDKVCAERKVYEDNLRNEIKNGIK